MQNIATSSHMWRGPTEQFDTFSSQLNSIGLEKKKEDSFSVNETDFRLFSDYERRISALLEKVRAR